MNCQRKLDTQIKPQWQLSSFRCIMSGPDAALLRRDERAFSRNGMLSIAIFFKIKKSDVFLLKRYKYIS